MGKVPIMASDRKTLEIVSVTPEGSYPTGAAVGSTYSDDDVAAISAFRDAALEMVRWHQGRADGFERRAASLLSMSGVATALVTFAVTSVGGLDRWAQTGVRLSAGAAAMAFLVAVACCLDTLRVRREATSAPELGQLQEEWMRFRQERDWHAADVEGMFADSLLSNADGMKAVLTAVKQFADLKARGVRRAAIWVAVAVFALAVLVFFALAGAA